MLKMYIIIRDTLSPGQAAVVSAHASLACYLKFKDDPETVEWIKGTFAKVICRVSNTEFERVKEFEDYVILTESTLDDAEVAIVFKPRKEWPKAFKYYRLYR